MRGHVLLSFILSAFAADAPMPALRIEVDGDGCALFVKNNHSAVLTGYWMEQVDYPGNSWQRRVDSTDGDAASGIAPGAETRTWVKNQTLCASPDYVKMQGAVYADGSTAGNVRSLISERRARLLSLREAIRRINADRDKPAQELIDSISMPLAKRLLRQRTVDETLEQLRRVESSLRESKPSLEP